MYANNTIKISKNLNYKSLYANVSFDPSLQKIESNDKFGILPYIL